MDNALKKVGIFLPITLGMLTAFGPFMTDFYLPSMPELMDYFKTSPSAVSGSLTAGMVGLAGGQILIGPLSDKYGRKRLLVLSMMVFAITSVLCILAPTIHVFNALRVVQGMAGAGGVVLAKSVATDLFTGKALSNFLALLGAINGIAPVCAPLIGGTLASFTSWQGVFCVLLAIGLVLMVCTMRMKESLPVEKRSTKGLGNVYGKLFKVFKNKLYTLSTISMMFTYFTFFAYISASPFIFQKIYGLTPLQYSLCFATNALCIGVGAGLATRFHHDNTALKWGTINLMIATLLVGVCHIMHLPLWLLMPCYIYMMVAFGIIQPVSTAIAMDTERDNAGAASAIFGAASFVAGAIVSPLVTIGDIMVSTTLVMVGGAAMALILTLPLCATIKKIKMQQQSAQKA